MAKLLKFLQVMCLLALLNTITSCESPKTQQKKSLMDEVMALHDSIMPISTKLGEMSMQLSGIANKLGGMPKGFSASEVNEASLHAKKSFEQMNSWMTNFNVPENMTDDDKSKYLQGEKIKLEKLLSESQQSLKECTTIISNAK